MPALVAMMTRIWSIAQEQERRGLVGDNSMGALSGPFAFPRFTFHVRRSATRFVLD